MINVQDASTSIPYEIINISDMPLSDFIDKLTSIKSTDAALLLSAYFDADGKRYHFEGSLKMILTYLDAPCYHLWKFGIGDGLLGGKVSTHYFQALTSSSIGKRVLKGEDIASIPLVKESPNVYMIDYEVMIKHSLPFDKLPEDSILINEPLTFRQLYPRLFAGIIIVIVFLLLTIIIMSLVLYYRRRLTQSIVNNNVFLKTLIEHITLPVVVKTLDNEYLLANTAFEELMNLPQDELIGSHTNELFTGDFLASLKNFDQEVIEKKNSINEIEFNNGKSDYYLRIRKSMIKNQNNEDLILTVAEDLTHLKAYEVELEKEVEKQTKELQTLNKTLEKLVIEDQLTRINNRRKLDEVLTEEYDRYRRYGSNFSVIMADIDHFKDVNDSYGHQVGDEVLIQVAKLMKETIRHTDCIGRWGGEEFLIICRNTPMKDTIVLAEKIRSVIEEKCFIENRIITCSFGVDDVLGYQNVERLISSADEALYLAKAHGRNRVEAKNNTPNA